MRTVRIGSEVLTVKDYHCADDSGGYLPKDHPKLWLYINLTNRCNGACPFCVNPAVKEAGGVICPEKLRETLTRIREWVGGVSITGGEPMLYPELVDAVAGVVTEVLGEQIPLELVTNGTRLTAVSGLERLDRFSAVHISRHCVLDAQNGALIGAGTPTFGELKTFLSGLEDPAMVVLNCVLQKGAVDSLDAVREYLEMAGAAGVRNVSFVGMFRANAYCEEHYISPKILAFDDDERFCRWNQYHDHDFCSCSSGDYRTRHGRIRFYYRCPGSGKPTFVRQLVYDHDNCLRTGFGGREINLREKL